jgi:hypothetical protein
LGREERPDTVAKASCTSNEIEDTMTDQDVDEIKARLDYLEAAMKIERTNGYMPYAEFRETMPDGLPPEIAELVASGQGVKAAMQLAKAPESAPHSRRSQ